MVTKVTYKKLLGIIFPLIIFSFIAFIYRELIWILYFKNNFFEGFFINILKYIYLFIFHILFILIIYCYIMTIVINPGQPPKFWGFYYEDPDDKKRRYCLYCHNFKPERCHHCSTCGHCVLVMDHHCPWLNNCVGFYNRKFFYLLLIYAITLCIIGIVGSIYPFYKFCSAKNINKINYYWFELTVCSIALLLVIIFFFTILNFFMFHYDLLDKNSTTLENLDEERGNIQEKNYDMGIDFNRKFVLGKEKLCWLLPFNFWGGEPNGDGVVQQFTNIEVGISSYDDVNDNNWNKNSFEKDSNPFIDKYNQNYEKENPINYNNNEKYINNNNNDILNPLSKRYF